MKINRRLLTMCLMFLSSALMSMEQDNHKAPLSLIDQCSMRIAHYLLQADKMPTWFKPDILPAEVQAKIRSQFKVSTVWDRLKDTIVSFSLKGHSQNISVVAISNDNSFIVTGSYDNTAYIWNAQNGELKHLLKGHNACISSVAISNDNNFIVTGSYDKTACVWSKNGHCCVKLKGHTGSITSVAISNNSKCIATGSHDGTVRLWNLLGECIAEFKSNTIDNDTQLIKSVVISNDDSFIVSISDSGFIRVWNVEDRTLKYTFEGNVGDHVAISNDDRFIVARCGSIAFVLSSLDGQLMYALNNGSVMITSVAVSKDSSFIVTGFDNGVAHIYNAQNGKLICKLESGHSEEITSVLISSDNSLIVTGSYDNCLVQLWDVAGKCLNEDVTNVCSKQSECEGSSLCIKPLALSSDASIIVSIAANNTTIGMIYALKDLQKANSLKKYVNLLFSENNVASNPQPLE